jgi:hypothetical protein
MDIVVITIIVDAASSISVTILSAISRTNETRTNILGQFISKHSLFMCLSGGTEAN